MQVSAQWVRQGQAGSPSPPVLPWHPAGGSCWSGVQSMDLGTVMVEALVVVAESRVRKFPCMYW